MILYFSKTLKRIELLGISNIRTPNLNPQKIKLCNSLSSFVRSQNLSFSYAWLQIIAFLSQLSWTIFLERVSLKEWSITYCPKEKLVFWVIQDI